MTIIMAMLAPSTPLAVRVHYRIGCCRLIALAYVSIVLVSAQSAMSQQPIDGQTSDASLEMDAKERNDVRASEHAQSPELKSKATPRRAPRYLDLRYDENFIYLDNEPGSYQSDFFDRIKNIRLGPDWRLCIGGEFRFRMEAETNKTFGAHEPAQDTFTLYRYLLHADLRYHELFRVFAQGAAMYDEHRDLALRPTDENRWDIHQLFFDLRFPGEELPLTLRVGRQELSYGNQRFVSPFEWGNIRRRFDGIKLFAKGKTWDVDLWYVKPVLVQRKQRDRYDEDFDFYGIYTTFKGISRHGIDVYFFAVDNTGYPTNPNGRSGDKNSYTLGSRFWGRTAGFDYEAEGAGQWGHWAGDTVCAWMFTLDAGYTFEHQVKPRMGAGFDWATGDRDPTDGKVETFDQLFPLTHKYFGFLDLVGRQNIIGPNVNFSFWPVPESVQAAVAWHYFWLADASDALYNAAGVPARRDATGRSGKEIGNELDLTVAWKIDVHSSLLVGWSHFWDAGFIQQTGARENADLFYIQYAFKF